MKVTVPNDHGHTVNADLLAALEAIMRRANERYSNASNAAMERDTVYAMHEIARAALAKAREVTP